jgi:hypothetical protein
MVQVLDKALRSNSSTANLKKKESVSKVFGGESAKEA